MYPHSRFTIRLCRLLIIFILLASVSARISSAAEVTHPQFTNERVAITPPTPTPGPMLQEISGPSESLMPEPEALAIPVRLRLDVEPSVAEPDDLITYTLTLTNTSDAPLTDLLVNAVFVPELVYSPPEMDREPPGEYHPNSYTLRYTLDVLKAGETAMLTFQARLTKDAAGDLPCSVFVGATPARAPSATAVVYAGGVRALRSAGTGAGLDAGWQLLYNPPVVSPFSGAAIYNYAVELPPGRNGLQPNLRLNYSSRAVDGVTYWVDSEWVGMGWSIDTVDIARRDVSYTWGNQGNYEWIDLSREFSLVINGTSYQLTPATNVTFDGRYYAENAPELSVELIPGSPANLKGYYWIVRTPNGTRYRLGYTSNSEQKLWRVYCSPGAPCQNDASPNDQVYRWRVDEVTDSFNNRMLFDYHEHTSYGRDYASYPANIWYNNYSAGWASRVEFVSSLAGVDPGQFSPILRTRRELNGVRVYHLGQLLREYVFTYGTEVHANASIERRLASIQLCGAGGVAGKCLPPTTFTYQDYENKVWELGGHQDLCDLNANPKWPFTDGTACRYWGEQFPYPRLVRVDNGYGGTTAFTYSSEIRNGSEPERYYAIIQSQSWDGVQHMYPDAAAPRTTYDYVGPCWDSSNQGCDIPGQATNALIGFSQTTERQQEYDGAAWQTLSGVGHQFDTSSYRTMGRETQTRSLDGADNILRQSDHIWNIIPGDNGFVYLGEERQTDYSGSMRTGTRVAYTYDEYGNAKAAYQYGAEEPVVNAGFERGADGWFTFPSPTPASITTTVSFAGRGSLRLHGNSNGGVYQDVAGLTPGETYVVRAWVQASSQTTAQFQIRLTDNMGTPVAPTTTWSQETLSFVANTAGEVRIHLYYLAGSGTIYVDEVALARTQDVGDERSTHRFFFNLIDNGRWLIGLRWGENLFAGITPNKGGPSLKQQTIWYYDDETHNLALRGESSHITRGVVTMTGQGLLSPSGQPFIITRFTYDPTWGNVTTERDGRDNITRTTYDDTYHLFPTEVCLADNAPERQCSQTEYYGVAGNPTDHGLAGQAKRFIDANGAWIEQQYDDFGRPTKVVQPGDSPDLPTTETKYHDGTQLWVSTSQREQSGQAGTLDSEVFYDGQGRSVRTRAEATDGKWAVSSTEYDTLGGVARAYMTQLHDSQVQVYEAERDFYHLRGSAQGSVWISPNVRADHKNAGWLSFGPYAAPVAAGPGQRACFLLAIAAVAGSNPTDPVAVLDVYDATVDQVLARQSLRRRDFLGGLTNMSEFCLVFDSSGRQTHLLEYRVYWQDYAKMAHDRVTLIWEQPTPADAPHTLTQYDALGRVVQVVGPDGSTTTSTYVGRTTSIVDANGHRRDSVTDAFGRQAAALEYVGGTSNPYITTYTYDVLGDLTRVTDAAGHVTTMTYDPLRRKISMSDPDMGQWSYGYDSVGNVITQTNALSQTIIFAYDALNRLIRKQETGGNVLAEYTYDHFDPAVGQYGRGRRTGMTDISGSTAWTYDQRGRLTAENRTIYGFGSYVTGFTYDALDRVTAVTYPDGEVVVSRYDDRGLLKRLAREDGTYTYVENANYNGQGQMTLIEFGAADLSLRTDYGYNAQNARLESLVTTGPSGPLQNLTYTYDAVGSVRSITDGMNNGQVQNFSYDALDRLVHAWTTGGGQGAFDETYAYDAIGNITEKDGVAYAYDPNHPHAVQTLVWGANQAGSFAYDANGSMISRNENGANYVQSFNVENRLASVTAGNATTTFVYDGDGKRVKKVESNDAATAYLSGYYEISYPPPPGKLVTGKLTNLGSAWRTVVLPNSYSSMVVVASPCYDSSDAPAVVRVRNATGNSFQIKVQNPSDQPLSGYTVHYLVVEAGVYNQAQHGVKMEAVKYASTVTDRATSWVGQSRSYRQSYTNPVVLGQVMTTNDPDWSVFWARGSSQGNPPTASSLFTGKHVGEDTDTIRTSETIGYIVIESGAGSIGDVAYVAALGPDSVSGMNNTPPFLYTINGPAAAEIAVVSAAAMDGGDGGWPVLYGDGSVSTSSLRLAFDEDQIADAERSHGSEEVPHIVFSAVKTLPSVGVRATKYYHANGQRVAMRVNDGSSDVVYYLHGDQLGSIGLVTTGDPAWAGGVLVPPGSEWSRQLYTPYGETRWSSGASPTDLHFTAQRHETNLGLYDYNARFYDPSLGRFISADAIVPDPGNPQDVNRYTYVGNNPASRRDPSGHFSPDQLNWLGLFEKDFNEEEWLFLLAAEPLDYAKALDRSGDPLEGVLEIFEYRESNAEQAFALYVRGMDKLVTIQEWLAQASRELSLTRMTPSGWIDAFSGNPSQGYSYGGWYHADQTGGAVTEAQAGFARYTSGLPGVVIGAIPVFGPYLAETFSLVGEMGALPPGEQPGDIYMHFWYDDPIPGEGHDIWIRTVVLRPGTRGNSLVIDQDWSSVPLGIDQSFGSPWYDWNMEYYEQQP